MKILIAPDKFKGSFSAHEVCNALSKGIKKSYPTATIISKPLADGGDGSLEVLDYYLELETITKTVQGPLGKPIAASYKIAGSIAYVELSAASGLILLKPHERNCLFTNTFGTGELIYDAIKRGANTIFLFVGGSATNDGGTGMANALGYQFYDAQNQLIQPIGKNLVDIHTIEDSQLLFDKNKLTIKVICDVNNPFYGPNGAAHVYAAQKGANPTEIIHLNNGLINLANQLTNQNYPDVSEVPGAGAAGGVAGGAIAFLDASLYSGIQTFLEITDLESVLKESDFVITGEGKLDAQTAQGKVISGVCQLALKYQKPIIAVCGDADEKAAKKLGINKVFTVLSRSTDLKEAMEKGAEKLVEIGEGIVFL